MRRKYLRRDLCFNFLSACVVIVMWSWYFFLAESSHFRGIWVKLDAKLYFRNSIVAICTNRAKPLLKKNTSCHVKTVMRRKNQVKSKLS